MYSAMHMENLIDAGVDVIIILNIKHKLGFENVDWIQLGYFQSHILVIKIL